MVRLVEQQRVSTFLGLSDGVLFDVFQSLVTIDVRLSGAEQVEVRAVEQEDFLGCHCVDVSSSKLVQVSRVEDVDKQWPM